MCGIVGVVGKDATSIVVAEMLSKIRTRGTKHPCIKDIGMGFFGSVLLDITDSNNGYQPIFTSSRSHCIVFNGEIYNYKELKEILIKKGYVFDTETDTEVLLYMYKEYGDKCVEFIRGMYAFAIYDTLNCILMLFRDPLGIKPLYYSIDKSIIYFASECKALVVLDVNKVDELMPGEILKYKDKAIEKKRYYNISDIAVRDSDEKSVCENIIRKIENAVRTHVDTDLPICVFFSGGIDSTIILYYSIKYNKNVTPIIIGHDDSEDVKYAVKYCEEFGVEYIRVDYDEKELMQSIPEVIDCIETFEINAVRASTLSYHLSRIAHQHGFKVALCGEGSDELFCGYGDFMMINDDIEFKDYTILLIEDVYRTQLLRVDRTSMAYSLEVRVPFFDLDVVEYALSLPRYYKINKIEGKVFTKYILRVAFEKILPIYITRRDKMTLMKGAGADEVDPEKGCFVKNAKEVFSGLEYIKYKNLYPTFRLESLESAYYFSLFVKKYKKLKFVRNRTINAKKEIDRD
jgi:asparagine synthase (glutamine-hydrolysing)